MVTPTRLPPPTPPAPRIHDFMKTIRPFFAEHLECEYCKQTHYEEKCPNCGAPKPQPKKQELNSPYVPLNEHKKHHDDLVERENRPILIIRVAVMIGFFCNRLVDWF